MLGVMHPGCPETYQSFPQGEAQQGEGQIFRDQHQKIQPLYRGDVVVLPPGVAHWAHNHGNDDLVLVVVYDTSNLQNQLDQNLRVLKQNILQNTPHIFYLIYIYEQYIIIIRVRGN